VPPAMSRGFSTWGCSGEAIWLGETTSMELGDVRRTHYTGVDAES
jgi:hypothetical protein